MFNRYILREVLTSWLGVTALLLVLLLTNEVARVLSRAADNQYPRSMVLELIGLGAVHNLTIIVPVGLLLGIVLALGRLYHDSEMSAALACGVSPARVYGPVLALALVLTAALSWLSLEVAPRAMAQVLNLRGIALRAGQFAPVAPGRFRTFGGGAAVVYAQGLAPDGTLTDVFGARRARPAPDLRRWQHTLDHALPRGALHGGARQRAISHHVLHAAHHPGADAPTGGRCE